MLKKLLHILVHPIIISLLLSGIVIYFIDPFFKLYHIKLANYEQLLPTVSHVYHDLDNDDYSETIIFSNYYENAPNVLIRDYKYKVLCQLDYSGKFVNCPLYYVADYDNDGLSEIYFFINTNDSIFLHGIDPFTSENHKFFKKFIDVMFTTITNPDVSGCFCRPTDVNNDGNKELVFMLESGYSLYPRAMYCLDIANDTIFRSPKSNASIIGTIAFDINDDSYDEYTFTTAAHNNWKSKGPYSDDHAWLMVLDKNLKFLFEPVKYGQHMTILEVVPYKPGDKTYLAIFQKYSGTDTVDNVLMLCDIHGNILKRKIRNDFEIIHQSYLMSTNESLRDNLFLIHSTGKIEELDSNLNMIREFYIDETLSKKPFRIDIDLDGIDEFVFEANNMQEFVLCRNDFSQPARFFAPNEVQGNYLQSLILRGEEKPLLFMQFKTDAYFFEYHKNPLYYFKYPIYAGIFAGIYLLIFLIYKSQQIRVKQHYEAEKKMADLQIKSIKNQVDPHFTLNMINSIGTLFANNDPEKANYVFGKYASMLRNTILHSDNIYFTLAKELEYVTNYLELEKFRLNDKFEYDVQVPENINIDFKIPKMLIYTFVENAIKHGIRHLEGKGELVITAESLNKTYTLTISDNGIGRSKAKDYSKFSTGKGLSILDQILDLYFKIEGVRINYEIIDILDDIDKPKGTKVIIKVPIKTKAS